MKNCFDIIFKSSVSHLKYHLVNRFFLKHQLFILISIEQQIKQKQNTKRTQKWEVNAQVNCCCIQTSWNKRQNLCNSYYTIEVDDCCDCPLVCVFLHFFLFSQRRRNNKTRVTSLDTIRKLVYLYIDAKSGLFFFFDEPNMFKAKDIDTKKFVEFRLNSSVCFVEQLLRYFRESYNKGIDMNI